MPTNFTWSRSPGRTVALVQSLILACATPAHPMVIMGGEPSPEEKSHLEGAKFKNVVGIQIITRGKEVAALKAKGIEPAQFYDGEAFKEGTLANAEIVGFGRFGTRTSAKLTRSGKVHWGETIVSYGTFRDRKAFRTWVPLTPAGAHAHMSGDPEANDSQFSLMEKKTELRSPDGKNVTQTLTHPNQAVPVKGDSGGPLFIKSKSRGHLLLGIYSSTSFDVLCAGKSPQRQYFLHLEWEAVMDHKDWIRAVRAGKAENAITLDLGSKAETAGKGKD